MIKRYWLGEKGLDASASVIIGTVKGDLHDIGKNFVVMKQTIEAIVESGCRGQVKIMVGGAPATQIFSDEIGADGFAPDGGSAPKLANSYIN